MTFSEVDYSWEGNLPNHFALARVSGLFTDLNPSAGGEVYASVLADRYEIRPKNDTRNLLIYFSSNISARAAFSTC